MEASFATIKTTCMIMFIVTGAAILSSAMAYLRVPQQLTMGLETVPLSKYFLFSIICVIYLGLGCLFDGVSLMVLTLPVVFPIIKTLGFDPIWFGIVLTILIETAQITPPVGFNLYVIQNISGHSIGRIVYGTIPFFLIMLLMVIILTLFPNIALILPNLMISAG
jgi:TRAP-type C4-dicarboxylate transport system permease large subunit